LAIRLARGSNVKLSPVQTASKASATLVAAMLNQNGRAIEHGENGKA
jgi:hypothetical protein